MTTEESYNVAIYDYYNVLFSTPFCVLREWVFDDPKTGHFILLFLLSLSPQNHINYIILLSKWHIVSDVGWLAVISIVII